VKPYYQDSACTIYLGDCREILPQLGPVDLVLTDPPYGIGADLGQSLRANTQRGNAAAPSRDYGQSAWDQRPPDASTIKAVLGVADKSIIWGGNYFDLPTSSAWLVWDKDNGNNRYADCELAWTNLPQAVRKLRFRWMGMLQEKAGREKETRFHPTQKPVPVMTWCLSFAPNAHTILDPFMGSGTTLRAAKDLGRKAIGIELEEKYCEIAARRLAQEVLL
jgi:DNA modification methylase